MRQSILIISLHAYPDPEVGAKRVSETANFLSNRGWQVNVVSRAGPFDVDGKRLNQGVSRIDIPVPPTIYSRLKRFVPRGFRGVDRPDRGGIPSDHVRTDNAGGLIGVIRRHFLSLTTAVDNYKRWSVRVLFRSLTATKGTRPDVVLASGPAWSPLVTAVLIGRIRAIPVVLDFRDPWVYMHPTPDPLDLPIRRWLGRVLEHWCIRSATAVTCASELMTRDLKQRYPAVATRIACIRNGFDADAELAPPQARGRLHILFAGTIYLNRNPMPLLEGIRGLLREPSVEPRRVHLTMVGDCREWRGVDLVKWIECNGLQSNVTVRPLVSPSAVRTMTTECDVLVNFAQGQKTQIPAKLFEQIAARRPILLFTEGDSESAMCVGSLSDVMRLDDDSEAVKSVLLEFYNAFVRGHSMCAPAQRMIDEYSRARANEVFLNVLERASGRTK